MNHFRIFIISIGMIFYAAAFFFPSDAGCFVAQKASWRILSADKKALYHAAKTILVVQGFKMERQKETEGILETAMSPMRLNLSGCDCDTALGGPVEDMRPMLHVAVAIAVDDNRISIRATIKGEYPKDQVSPAIIEDDLFNQIARYLK